MLFEPFTETRARQRLLLIDDDLSDAANLSGMLSNQETALFHVEHVADVIAALERLHRGGIELILMDLGWEGGRASEIFAQIQAAAPHVPVILLTDVSHQDLANQLVREGAQDYLVKGHIDTRLLLRAIRYASKRKRAETALAQERDLLRTLLRNIPDRIYFKDQRSRFIRINPALASHFMLRDPQEAVGKSDFDFFTTEHAQAAYDDEQRIMRTGQPVVGIIEKETHPDGRVTWAFTSKMPLRDRQGKIVGTFGLSRDITEIKNFENALAAERNLLRNLIDHLPDYIYVKDAEGRYLLDNTAHRQFLGAENPLAVIGKMPADFFTAEFAAAIYADDAAAMKQGRPMVNRETRLTDRHGQPRWHLTTKVPLRDSAQQIIGLVCISRDVTEPKEAEERLRQANSELTRSREELLKVLGDLKNSHEELRVAQFQLIQAAKLESVGTLAAGVAHEVKNPLQTILMGVDYLTTRFSGSDSDVDLVLTELRDAVHRADAIVRDLLEFSAANRLTLEQANLNQVIEKSLLLVNFEMTRGRIEVVKELCPDLPLVCLDRTKIEQVMINTFVNAIQAMPGGGKLTVRTRLWTVPDQGTGTGVGPRTSPFRSHQQVAVIEVEDTGVGIPEEHLSKIFDPFFTTKPVGQGTGLGLPITKKIIELHSGTVEIKNRPSGGVSVSIMLKTATQPKEPSL